MNFIVFHARARRAIYGSGTPRSTCMDHRTAAAQIGKMLSTHKTVNPNQCGRIGNPVDMKVKYWHNCNRAKPFALFFLKCYIRRGVFFIIQIILLVALYLLAKFYLFRSFIGRYSCILAIWAIKCLLSVNKCDCNRRPVADCRYCAEMDEPSLLSHTSTCWVCVCVPI